MKQVSFLLIGLLAFSLKAYSGGTADTGGGNAVGDQLLDLYENEGVTTIDVTRLEAYKQILVPIFKKLDSKVKFFSVRLMAPSANKTWFLDPKTLTDAACINQSMISVEKTIVGCQDTLEVRLSQSWYQNQANLKNQAALIMHEFVRAHALKNGNMSDGTVKSLTRLLLNPESISEQQLISAIVDSQLGSNTGENAYITATEWAPTKKWLNVVYGDCLDGKKNVSWYNDVFNGEYANTPAIRVYHRYFDRKLRAKKMTCAELKSYME